MEIYYNARIYTGIGDDGEAMAVESGRILCVGTLDKVNEEIGKSPKATYHDLKGKFVVPGFNDSHLHLLNLGHTLSLANLTVCTSSLSDMLLGLVRFMEAHSENHNGWVVGRGWNHDYFQDEKRFPNRWDLDLVSTSRPILVIRACGHIACANSAALAVAGITKDTLQPEGGCFDLDENGEPTGVFREYGVDMISQFLPQPSLEEIKEILKLGMKELNRFGITSAQSDDLATFPGVSYKQVLEAYKELEYEGEMTVKVYEQSLLSDMDLLRDFMSQGYHTGVGREFFRIGPLKLLADGSLGARTAYLGQAYEDDEEHRDNRGIAIYSQAELDELVSFAHGGGMQIAVHAIGDGAMEMVIHSIKKALSENPREDHRHGIVHCQITTKKLLEDFQALNLHAYVQTIFLDYDSHIIESRVGVERAKDTYQFRKLLYSGVDVSNGSDCPVERPDVMAGIQCAVTRTTLDGTTTFLMEEALTVEEAIDTYTIMGARASFEEKEKGQLTKGMAADFTVLEKDIRRCEPNRIREVPVCETYVNGKCVYQKKN